MLLITILTFVLIFKDRNNIRNNFAIDLTSGKIQNILIVGDSISDGNGSSHYVSDQNERERVGARCIFINGEEKYFESLPEAESWVYYFRNYVKDYFQDETVPNIVNASIGGKSAKWGNENKEAWINERYDAIFLALGMNDRVACKSESEFEKSFKELCIYAKQMADYVIVMTPVPAIEHGGKSEVDYYLRLPQISDIIKKVSKEQDCICIDLYNDIISFSLSSNIPIDEFFWGGVHPNNYGYLTIWRQCALDLGLSIPLTQVYDRNEEVSTVQEIGIDSISSSTLLYEKDLAGEDVFPVGVTTCAITMPYFCLDIEYPGTVVTYRYADGWGKQIFKPFYIEENYIRYYDSQYETWTEWKVLKY